MKRKLFSKKDGTTMKQDISDIKEEIKARFEHLPIELKRLLPIAEDIVIHIQLFSEMLEEGHPFNEAAEKILAITKTEVDDRLYELLKVAFQNLAQMVINGYSKFEVACGVLKSHTYANDVEADTAIQLAVYAVKS